MSHVLARAWTALRWFGRWALILAGLAVWRLRQALRQ